MLKPELIYEEHPYKDEVAVMVSFVPSFLPPELDGQRVQPVDAEVPQSATRMNGEDFFYVFIVDRSGSMQLNADGSDSIDKDSRIKVTKDALKLFMQSLSPKCKFQIISFGTKFSKMGGAQVYFEYKPETLERAKEHIEGMDADMVGTEILEPLSHAIDDLAPNHKEVRIFLLTDGDIDDPTDRKKVIEKCNTGKDNIRIHTFGIGGGCDKDMVQRMAEQGRGTCSLTGNDVQGLEALVIKALECASSQSLPGCELAFGDETENLREIFENQLLTRTKIMTHAQFDALTFRFGCGRDPSTGQPLNEQFSARNFVKVEKNFGLFQAAKREEISKLPRDQQVQEAMNYQLLVQIDNALPVGGNKIGLKELIELQNSSGFWPDQYLGQLGSYFKNGSSQDQALRAELQNLANIGDYQVGDILTTIIALHLLEEKYDESSDEWNLVAKKAKAWLNQAGISELDEWLEKVNLTVK